MAAGTPSALHGLLVADFSRVLAGPLVAMTLGDLGADVVKVESPSGDDTRTWGPPFAEEGGATYFLSANRNKRSIVLDLRRDDDSSLAHNLCERADVVVANFRPGTLERFGLAYDDVVVANPRVIYCEISGFGEDGGRDLPGYDPLIQAVGGLMSVTGQPESPAKTGVAFVDVIAGLYATIAVLAALRERESSGKGQRVTVNLMHVALAALVNQASAFLAGRIVPQRLGNDHPSIAPFSTYHAADGDLMICAGNDRQFRALVGVLGAPELANDERFVNNSGRVHNASALREALEACLQRERCSVWVASLADAMVPAGQVNSIADAFALAERLRLNVVDTLGGTPTVTFPASLSRTPASLRRRPPRLDEHGDEIRAWLAS